MAVYSESPALLHASCDRDMVMTSETDSQSDGSVTPAILDHNYNQTDSGAGGVAVEAEMIVSIDGRSGGNVHRVLTRGKHDPAAARSGSVPDVVRLLPPISWDYDSGSAAKQGLAAPSGDTGPSLRSARSSSPLLVLDRRGGPGLCFRAADSEKMLPALMAADAGLHLVPRLHGPLSHGNQGGSLSGISRPFSPRPPSPCLLHHPSKDKPTGTSHHLHMNLCEDKHRFLVLDPEPTGRTHGGPLNDITDVHPSLLRRRSCQSPNRLVFPERRRASEGVLNITPSQLGFHPQSRIHIEPRLQQQAKAAPFTSRSRGEIGELMSTVPSRKPKGQKTAHAGTGHSRLSRLSSASLESVTKHDTGETEDIGRQRILSWLEGVKRGKDRQTDKSEDLRAGQLEPLSRSSTETAIRIIHKDRK